jgi:hypothetical protein
MAAFVAAISLGLAQCLPKRDARVKPTHDTLRIVPTHKFNPQSATAAW